MGLGLMHAICLFNESLIKSWSECVIEGCSTRIYLKTLEIILSKPKKDKLEM
jgi:hypothetical protein